MATPRPENPLPTIRTSTSVVAVMAFSSVDGLILVVTYP